MKNKKEKTQRALNFVFGIFVVLFWHCFLAALIYGMLKFTSFATYVSFFTVLAVWTTWVIMIIIPAMIVVSIVLTTVKTRNNKKNDPSILHD